MPEYKPFFPVIGARRTITGEATPVLIEAEKHQITDMHIKLHEVPKFVSGAQNVIIPGYTEVFKDPNPGEYRVNYGTGRVFFHTSQEEGSVSVTYEGLGSLTAVDEINWMWEQLLQRKSFTDMTDTPVDYEFANGKYLRVNEDGTGIEFIHPTVGRSVAEYIFKTLGAGETAVVTGSRHDVISFYETHASSETGMTLDTLTWDVDGPAIAEIMYAPPNEETDPEADPETDGESRWFTIDGSVPDAETVMYKRDLGNVEAWNSIISMWFEALVAEGQVLKAALFLNDVPVVWDGFKFASLPDTTAATLLSHGNTADELKLVPAYGFSNYRDHPIGIAVVMKADADGNAPMWSGMLELAGTAGGGYSVSDKCDAILDIQENRWEVTNTSDESSNFVFVLGSGRDDICCTSDAIDFPEVAPDAPFFLKSPAQSVLQVYAEVIREPEATVGTSDMVDFIGINEAPSLISHPHVSFAVQQSLDSKNAFSGVSGVTDFLNFKDANFITDGGVEREHNDSIIMHPGYTGYGVKIGTGAGIRMRSSFNFSESRTAHGQTKYDVNYNTYANYAIGGMFKWVSGAPMIIFPDINIPYSSTYGYYSRVWVRLYEDRVRLYMHGKSTDIEYTPGTWAYVALDYLRCRYMFDYLHAHLVPLRKRGKYARICVNGTYKTLSYWVTGGLHLTPSIAYSYQTFPGTIGDRSSQFTYGGEFLCDMAFVANSNNISGTNTAVMDAINDGRSALAAEVPYLMYKVAQDITVDDIHEIRSIITGHTGAHGNTERFFIESDGELLAYDPDADVFREYNVSQPYETLYGGAMTPETLNSIPDWRVNAVRGNQMNIVQISRTAVGEAYTGNPDDFIVGSLSKKLSFNAEERSRTWQMLRPGVDYTAEWVAETRTWKIVSMLEDTKNIRAIAAGLSAKEAIGGLTAFTELVDGPDTLNYPEHQILTGKGGKVQSVPYLNPLMTSGV